MNNNALYTISEEVFNAVTHGIGALLSLVGGIVLLMHASGQVAMAAALIYVILMVLLYSASTFYHAMPLEKAKKVLRVIDHSSVYLLIAGTYTPFILILLIDSPRAYVLFAGIWIMAIIGIILKVIDIERFKMTGLVFCLAMGWLSLLEVRDIAAGLGFGGMALLVGGGICYTVGVVFYKMKNVKYMHGIWHLFVLGGSILHYFCILFYVVM